MGIIHAYKVKYVLFKYFVYALNWNVTCLIRSAASFSEYDPFSTILSNSSPPVTLTNSFDEMSTNFVKLNKTRATQSTLMKYSL